MATRKKTPATDAFANREHEQWINDHFTHSWSRPAGNNIEGGQNTAITFRPAQEAFSVNFYKERLVITSITEGDVFYSKARDSLTITPDGYWTDVVNVDIEYSKGKAPRISIRTSSGGRQTSPDASRPERVPVEHDEVAVLNLAAALKYASQVAEAARLWAK